MEYKQVILVRSDLLLSKGKMAAQASHASVGAVLKSGKDVVKKWQDQGMKKVVLEVKDLNELLRYKTAAADAGLISSLVTDAGHTHLVPGTVTCLGIGPAIAEEIDKVTGSLKLIA